LVFAEQTILGQEPSEEHPVPMLVGDLLEEGAELLFAVSGADISQLTSMRPQSVPKRALRWRHSLRRRRLAHAQCCQGRAGAFLGRLTGLEDLPGQQAAGVRMQGGVEHT